MHANGKRLTVAAAGLVAVLAFFAFVRANPPSNAVQVAFVGDTRFGNHAGALFAITNRLNVGVYGTAYLQTKTALGWRGHSLDSQKNRAAWVGPVHGAAQSVTLLGIARPATTNEWRLLVTFFPKTPGGLQRPRQRCGDFFIKHGFVQLGAWVQPRPKPEYAFGPEMKNQPL